MKNIFYIGLLFLLFGCRDEKNCINDYSTFSLLENNTSLKIRDIGFFYKNNFKIYSIALPTPNCYNSFIDSYFIIIDKYGCVYSLLVNESCYDDYKQHSYVFMIDSLNMTSKISASICDVEKIKILDFNIKKGDTVSLYNSSRWFCLESKIYSKELKDTIYNFTSHFLDVPEVYTSVSKQKGILGIANKNNKLDYNNVLGKIWVDSSSIQKRLNDSIRFYDSSLNIDLIKEFNKCFK